MACSKSDQWARSSYPPEGIHKLYPPGTWDLSHVHIPLGGVCNMPWRGNHRHRKRVVFHATVLECLSRGGMSFQPKLEEGKMQNGQLIVKQIIKSQEVAQCYITLTRSCQGSETQSRMNFQSDSPLLLVSGTLIMHQKHFHSHLS